MRSAQVAIRHQEDKMLQGARLLIVDDEKAMRLSLSEIFRMRGAQVATAADGREAVELLNEHDFDLMLLDLKMPGMSGMQVLEVAQKVRPGTVVILLTAFATLDSAIAALRRGAHDYLLKPCEPRALIAGVERGLAKRGEFRRRQSLVGLMEQTVSALKTVPTASPVPTPPPPGGEELLGAADLTIDLKKRLALMGNQTLTLSPTEFNVLVHFVRNPDRAITCSELVREGLRYECTEQEARPVIRVHIHRLRQKIEADPDNPKKLVTVRAAGYMLVTET
ncbi:MAG: two component transcriptional regulator, winged helix family [Chloroflexi bacterium]|nr:two component transcriptional regulator, winged helix family [Chloroflexota bacterium]